jgi:hypothetical protein
MRDAYEIHLLYMEIINNHFAMALQILYRYLNTTATGSERR